MLISARPMAALPASRAGSQRRVLRVDIMAKTTATTAATHTERVSASPTPAAESATTVSASGLQPSLRRAARAAAAKPVIPSAIPMPSDARKGPRARSGWSPISGLTMNRGNTSDGAYISQMAEMPRYSPMSVKVISSRSRRKGVSNTNGAMAYSRNGIAVRSRSANATLDCRRVPSATMDPMVQTTSASMQVSSKRHLSRGRRGSRSRSTNPAGMRRRSGLSGRPR